MRDPPSTAVYGAPPGALIEPLGATLQVSPLSPGAASLEDLAERSLARMVMAAPPGVLERRRALALALRALRVGARLTALAPKDRGGARLRKELQQFGCGVQETAKRHHRICSCERPDVIEGLEEAIADGAPRRVEPLSLWSQPGIFSWDRIDPGSASLLSHLPPMAGAGADLGCGVGVLAKAVLSSRGVTSVRLIDIDRRAIEAARRNIDDPRAELRWADVTAAEAAPADLDFVVTNPPFHDGGVEDRELGRAFIRCAAHALRRGGALWLVANRHLPYEAGLASLFARVDVRAEEGGYKVLEARR